MTSYHGGKQRIGSDIASKIHDTCVNLSMDIEGYCEPFCGMLGVYKHIPDLLGDIEYIAGDANKSVILMWKKAQKGWVPPIDCTEERYLELCASKRESGEKGFICHQYSFGGQYCKGFNKKYDPSKNSVRSSKRVVDMSKKLKTTDFSHGDYTQYNNLENFVIYCDPPFKGSECHYQKGFSHEHFWEWVRTMSEKNLVFVSEYNAPKDFTPILSKKHTSHHRGRVSTGKETLYMMIT
jgi:DNA adenine methylase